MFYYFLAYIYCYMYRKEAKCDEVWIQFIDSLCRMWRLPQYQILYFFITLMLLARLPINSGLRLGQFGSSRAVRARRSSAAASTPSAELTQTGQGDEHLMRLALRHAQLAYRQKEVPIGAVVVETETGKVLSTARNSVEKHMDGTAHAEMVAIQKAVQVVGNWRLSNCTLYTTLEPCPMCMGAIQSSRIGKVVYGAKDHRLGACGSWIDLVKENQHPFHRVEIRGGVCEFECSDILKRFFRWRRSEAKEGRNKGDLSTQRAQEEDEEG